MEEIKKLQKQKEEIEKKIAELEQQNIIYDDGEIKIIKWENKKLGEFNMPKGYDWASFHKFCKLVSENKISAKPYQYFACKHPIKNKYPLFGACLYYGGGWCAIGDDLAGSSGNGRVVLEKNYGVDNL